MLNLRFRKVLTLILSLTLVVALIGCGNSGKSDKNKQINILSWGGDFIPREIIDEFEEATGVKVNLQEVQSNEETQTLLETNPDQYDLAVVTDYMVDILRQTEYLEKLDKEKLSNMKNINPAYQGNYYDEKDEYSIPYAVSTSFLLVNPEGVAELGADPITEIGRAHV